MQQEIKQVEVITKVYMIPVINYDKWYVEKRKCADEIKRRS